MKRSSLAVAAFGIACSHIVDLTQASSRQEIPTSHYTRENRRWRGAKLSPAERVMQKAQDRRKKGGAA